MFDQFGTSRDTEYFDHPVFLVIIKGIVAVFAFIRFKDPFYIASMLQKYLKRRKMSLNYTFKFKL